MSKLPEDLPWSENAATLLAETDKTSVKAVCTTIRKVSAPTQRVFRALPRRWLAYL